NGRLSIDSRVSDGSGILLRGTKGFFFPQISIRKRYSGQHGPQGNAIKISLFVVEVILCVLIRLIFILKGATSNYYY
ncbi:MAG: hypothetical protein ACN6OI_17880, partial [Flavobacterium sp.]|uniref:hypothetical protein n=1 Tax=Flavobacterium sp. TaxID=239 RepID=UPI003D102E45